MTQPADETPDQEQVAAWLELHGHPADWAPQLAGLPWKYIEPVVTIAASTGNQPLMALAGAAVYSTDPDFKTTAASHIHARGGDEPAGPNRAQRRAAKRGRRG